MVAPMKTSEASSQPRFTPEMVCHRLAGPMAQLSLTCSASVRSASFGPELEGVFRFTGEDGVQNPRHQNDANRQFQREYQCL